MAGDAARRVLARLCTRSLDATQSFIRIMKA
jgi:hypothetical protein